MSERTGQRNDKVGETAPADGGDAVTETAEASSSANVRDVVGRRGYDESEDETASEDEEH